MASRVAASLNCAPRGSGGGEPAGRYEDRSKMTSKRTPFQTQLRRSISEQLRDSTARAWDRLWKNVRERRLAGRCPRYSGACGGRGRRGSRRSRWPTAPPPHRRFRLPHSVSEPGLGPSRRLTHPPWPGLSASLLGAPHILRAPVGVGSAPRARCQRDPPLHAGLGVGVGCPGESSFAGRFALCWPRLCCHPPDPVE